MRKVFSDRVDTRLMELRFTQRDTDIFAIPDARARVDALQNYFFPRLEVVLDECIRQIKAAYDLDALATMAFIYHPYPRAGKATRGVGEEGALMGLGGRREVGRTLKLKKPDGRYALFHPGRLSWQISREGAIDVVLQPFGSRFGKHLLAGSSRKSQQSRTA